MTQKNASSLPLKLQRIGYLSEVLGQVTGK